MNKSPEDSCKRVEGSDYKILHSSYLHNGKVECFIVNMRSNAFVKGYFPTYNAAKQYLIDTGLVYGGERVEKKAMREYRIRQIDRIEDNKKYPIKVKFFYSTGNSNILDLDKDMAILIINKLTEEYLNK